MNGQDLTSLIWHGPSDPPTVAELQQAWEQMKTIKRWPNVQEFMTEFTMPEKGAIALSMDPTIAAMRLELTTWLSEVHADDPRVVAGINRIVELGIITPERKNTILSL